jgi:CRP/FNR family cyclic AMP-dependent transcriptional regulator
MVAETVAPAFLTDASVDLDQLLGPRLAASPEVRGMVMLLREGPWDPESIPARRRTPLGILVLEGVLARDLGVAGLEATELIGEGDVLDPWTAAPADAFLPASASWSVLLAGRILVIDPALMREAAQRPSILGGLYAGAARRAGRLALHQAIAQLPRVELRILALLWHLAGRWGRVGPEGIVVPLPLSHARLGRLVGSRRPTVTLALRELAERGHVVRRADGSWQLGPAAPPVLEGLEETPARRRRKAPSTPDGDASISLSDGNGNGKHDPIDRMAAELYRHVHEARMQAEAQQATLPSNLLRLSEARRRSEELRSQSVRLREQFRALRADRQPGPDED